MLCFSQELCTSQVLFAVTTPIFFSLLPVKVWGGSYPRPVRSPNLECIGTKPSSATCDSEAAVFTCFLMCCLFNGCILKEHLF